MLEPMTIMFASKGYKLDDVIQEVRRMQTQWQHSDYRAWLKHYTTGKRPRSAMEDSKQLLRRDGGDSGAGPRDIGTGPASCLQAGRQLISSCHVAVVHDASFCHTGTEQTLCPASAGRIWYALRSLTCPNHAVC